MRGWTHYLSGLAMTTFFPSLLRDLAGANLLPAIAGVYAYLPDFLDFKVKRFSGKETSSLIHRHKILIPRSLRGV